MKLYKRLYLFKKTVLLSFAIFIFGTSCSGNKESITKDDITIIPIPENIAFNSGYSSFDKEKLTISIPETLSDMFTVFEKDYFALYGKLLTKTENGTITFELDNNLSKETYKLDITSKISIKGGSAESLMMGWVSMLQLVRDVDGKLLLPKCTIQDKPFLGYRGLLLDIARQFQSIESVKQVIDVCRWYKINYMQIHLSDDQLFTFPSDAFPNAPTKGKSYTKTELKELVEYARIRGVAIIPEFDSPGHTGSLRAAYPEIFGSRELGMLDVGNPKALEGCKTLIGEMIDIFYTSPYFHIGADEVWMGNFKKLASTQKAVKEKNFDTPYDLYLNYIVEMHNYVKSRGKQTLAWESFEKNGSPKVKIPNDILIFAWETMYQRPDDLLKYGYTLLNASWKPCYITPQHRWSQSQLYHWNIWRWEHFLDIAPSWKPIQFEKEAKDKVIGAQLCAWEMSEEANLPSILPRLPALSENVWNPYYNKDYTYFSKRFEVTDEKLKRILFPAKIIKEGLTAGVAHERFYNRENYFADKVKISVQSDLPDVNIRYTTDGTVPNIHAPILSNQITIDSTSILRIAIFKKNQIIGYRSELLEKRPVELIFSNTKNDPESPLDGIESFTDSIRISYKSLHPDYLARYTLDGSLPISSSPVFKQELVVKDNVILHIQCFDKNGVKQGSLYNYRFKKIKD